MCTPEALASRHRDVVVGRLGLEAKTTRHDQSLVITYERLSMVLVNTAPAEPETVEVLCPLSYDEGQCTADDVLEAVDRVMRRHRHVKVLVLDATQVLLVATTIAAAPRVRPTAEHLEVVLPPLLETLSLAVTTLLTDLDFRAITRAEAPPCDS